MSNPTCLDWAPYTEPRKAARGQSAVYTLLSLETKKAAKILRGILPEAVTVEQANAVHNLLLFKANACSEQWKTTANHAAWETFGREWQVSDYQVSGVGRNEFPEFYKGILRQLAFDQNQYKAAALVWFEVWRSLRRKRNA